MWRNKLKTGGFLCHALAKYRCFIIFDTETMGLKDYDKILQFSAILFEINNADFSFKEVDSINIYMNPGEDIPEKITKITGISNAFIFGAPKETETAPDIFSFLERGDFWMAYNAMFDYKKLVGMAARCGISMKARPIMDLLPMARDCFVDKELEDFKLETVAEYCVPDTSLTFHSAIDDVRASEAVFRECIRIYQDAILDSYQEEKKKTVHLNWASLSINPRQPSMQRIKLNLNDNRYGNIFWDLRKKCWDCKKDKYSRSLFEETDLINLENQFIRKYGWKYGNTDNIDVLTENWLKEYKAKEKEKKQKNAKSA